MKKILAKLAQVDSDDVGNPYNNFRGGTSSHHASFIGRQYHVGHFSLVVEDTIAEGGFGMVFRVRSQQGQHYALKRTCVNSSQDLAVCKREITIVSSLSHRNILRYIDSRIDRLSQGVYEVLLLTVFYPASLSQFLQERKQAQQRLTEVEVLRIFCDLCEAVCRLHHCKTPVIHRDLKIENVLIDERKNFVLCDFGSATSRVLLPSMHGLARCKEEIDRYTTLAYRAPELIDLYSNVPLGPQIDIWAMGCLLYCLCFGNLPFGDSALAIQSGNYSLPDSSPYSERLHKLIGYLLSVNAYKRPDIYQTCALAFSLSGRSNPAQNLNNLSVPRWQDLTVPMRESQLKTLPTRTEHSRSPQRSPKAEQSTFQKSINRTIPDGVGNTSVVPRQRPRATSSHSNAINSGSVRPFASVPGDTTATVPIVIKPPPPPASQTVVQPQLCSAHGDRRVVPTDPFEEQSSGERAKRLGWEADFSNPFPPTTESTQPISTAATALPKPVSTVPTVPVRGHQRTWSADVGYMNRVNPLFNRPTLAHCPDTDESKLHKRNPDTQAVCNPFPSTSSSTNLRHVQSLVSLPTSTAFGELTSITPVETVAHVRPDQTFTTIHSEHRSPQVPSVDTVTQPVVSAWSFAPNTKPPSSMVDEDVLFGAAFDAIRRAADKNMDHSYYSSKPWDNTCTTLPTWTTSTDRAGSFTETDIS